MMAGLRGSVVARGRVTTGAEVRDRALGLARHWVNGGLRPGQRVLVLVPPGAEFAATVLGLVWAGAVPVLVDPDGPEALFHARVAAAAPAACVVDPRLPWVWRARLHRLLRRWRPLPPRPGCALWPLPRRVSGELPAEPREAHDEALLLFTSGTTAAPRGVVHAHGNVAAFLGQVEALVGGLVVDRYLAEHPQQVFYALQLGARCHVLPGASGPGRLQASLHLLPQVDAWFTAPWAWQALLKADAPIPHTLRSVILGSAPVTRGFLQRLLPALPPPATVRCVYGSTEAGPTCRVDGQEKVERDGAGDWVGRPLPGVELSIDDAGHVRVGGPSVAARYLDGSPTRPSLDTGDLGRLDDQGLWLLGRAKDMILRHGKNLYPGVLEPLLHAHVPDAALVGVYDPLAHTERVVLFHTGPEGFDPRPVLAEDAPDHVVRVDELPRSGRQRKVDKEALREHARHALGLP